MCVKGFSFFLFLFIGKCVATPLVFDSVDQVIVDKYRILYVCKGFDTLVYCSCNGHNPYGNIYPGNLRLVYDQVTNLNPGSYTFRFTIMLYDKNAEPQKCMQYDALRQTQNCLSPKLLYCEIMLNIPKGIPIYSLNVNQFITESLEKEESEIKKENDSGDRPKYHLLKFYADETEKFCRIQPSLLNKFGNGTVIFNHKVKLSTFHEIPLCVVNISGKSINDGFGTTIDFTDTTQQALNSNKMKSIQGWYSITIDLHKFDNNHFYDETPFEKFKSVLYVAYDSVSTFSIDDFLIHPSDTIFPTEKLSLQSYDSIEANKSKIKQVEQKRQQEISAKKSKIFDEKNEIDEIVSEICGGYTAIREYNKKLDEEAQVEASSGVENLGLKYNINKSLIQIKKSLNAKLKEYSKKTGKQFTKNLCEAIH